MTQAIHDEIAGNAGAVVRRRVVLRGVVQGVGCRPYVYGLAERWKLNGFVRNTARGVVIEVEGAADAVESFLTALPRECPPLMRIDAMEVCELDAAGDAGFEILASEAGELAFAAVPADVCVCDACLAEVHDPQHRRFEYPFANCTNCGPRYSIIEDVPYDRAQTTMREFSMCADCLREYGDPGDRHFHAQPNACPVCGPRLQLAVGGVSRLEAAGSSEILSEVARMLLAGKIVAWKGLGGYQLACDARSSAAVSELRRRKHRNEKPFAVMVRDENAARKLCSMDDTEQAALLSVERPIVLLARLARAGFAAKVSGGLPSTGVMLPATPMHDLLFRVLAEQSGQDVPLVMTSGNLSEEPIAIDDTEAAVVLAPIADALVSHNRRIHTRVDDSLVRVVDGSVMMLRRARGYAPQAIPLRGDAEVLACGAQLKSTLCLTKAGFAMLSQHLGDLENYETLQFFEQTLERMQRLFHVSPKIVAHDLHPNYMSTRLALRLPAERHIGVQHHHAHVAACMVEHGLEGQVIGIAWDGMGFGTDGTVWGGEFFVGGYAGFERVAHLRPVTLVGGDAAVREPWRIARAYLRDAFGDSFDSGLPAGIASPQSVGAESVRIVDAMLERRIQAIATSSCGRLFDAVASLCGVCERTSFEGQAAMLLEAIAGDGDEEIYDMPIDAVAGNAMQLDTRPMIRSIVDELERSVPIPAIAARFHRGLVRAATEVCEKIRQDTGLQRVCLGGGCFQNVRLLRGCLRSLRAEGFEVFFPQRVPSNDGGIALGQAAIACELVRQGA
jgi:hydrogenase maturation protein HypF